MKHLNRRAVCICLTLLLLAFLGTPILSVEAKAGPADRRVPYQFVIDDLFGKKNLFGDERPVMETGWTLKFGQTLTFSGWLAVGEGVSRYEYAFVGANDLSPDWKVCENTVISKRPDLTQAGVPYVTGHDTAGFTVTVTAPASGDGYYDFYLRGVSGDDVFCDLIISVGVIIGLPDTDNSKTHEINLARLARDAGSVPGVSFESDGSVRLSGQGVLDLGTLDLGLYESVSIRYTLSDGFRMKKGGDCAILGLKSEPQGSRTGSKPDAYTRADGKYDLTDSLAFCTVPANSERVQLDLKGVQSYGHTYLTAYTFGEDEIRVLSVSFTYAGTGGTKVAAKIRFSGDLEPYFYSPNCCTIRNIHDDVMGDVLRFEPPEATNDTYIHFNVEGLLETKNVRLSADDYKYMVVLCRARKGNAGNRLTFYLCPGAIGGPTEECTKTFETINDSQWHYYVLDLNTPATWQGVIHLWRFDCIQGSSNPGDWVDFASIQFFRTADAAKAAASVSTTKSPETYACGGDPVILDMSEEEALAAAGGSFTPAANRTYVFEEPVTEAPTEAPTEPAAPPTSAAEESDPATEPDSAPVNGCRSAVCLPLPALALLASLSAALIRTKQKPI